NYDAHEEIYKDLIKVIANATAALSDSADIYEGEVLYGGNIDQWKKLGNSLMFRLGMRLSKVDPTLAQTTVSAAFSGGLLESNDDNFVIRHDSNYQNATGNFLNGAEANNFYLVDVFVDYLSGMNDPRLGAISVRYVGAASGPDQTGDVATNDPALQVGMPMGNTDASIGEVANDMGLVGLYDFSQADRSRIAKSDGAQFILTYAQTQLLLAEAATRGWVTGEAASYYERGVRAHMEQMALHDPSMEIDPADIDAYILNHPFDEANALEQINTQYWVASFMNGPEAFANFRRSGFPKLTANSVAGQDISGDFINRLTYPTEEVAVNKTNLDEAVNRMGPDNLDTKVWWDQ
ncbi:SusD/RagB family nutrient-binding outer membrane lipoprotein, partial [Labrenzia sp. 011]|uniref:SusD/RagB family nutrient-binding outer membrane lipoprotein n=1 Tax=Labrenzia sp. 011 TaxID=2171494 RepID=UPI000D524F44